MSLMENNEFNAAVCFLSDVFNHLNQLNMELQGRDKTVSELVEKRHAFQRKLSLFSADLCPGKMLHFPTLRKSGLQITEVMSGFIDSLKNIFVNSTLCHGHGHWHVTTRRDREDYFPVFIFVTTAVSPHS